MKQYAFITLLVVVLLTASCTPKSAQVQPSTTPIETITFTADDIVAINGVYYFFEVDNIKFRVSNNAVLLVQTDSCMVYKARLRSVKATDKYQK